jgi:bifunctional DNase/RNase
VTEMRDNTFFARIFYAGPTGEVTDVDARPSDAINLAVRFGAPIYVAKQVVTGSAYLMNGTDYTPLADGTLPLGK